MSMCARAISSGRQDQALRRSHLHSADVACECPILVTTVWNRKQSIPYCENNAGHLEIEVLHTHTHTHTHTYTGFISMTTGHGFPMNINSNSLREKELEHRRGEQNATERKYNKTNEQSNSFFFCACKVFFALSCLRQLVVSQVLCV